MSLQPRRYAFRVGLFLAFGLVMLLTVLLLAVFPKLSRGGPQYTIRFAESVGNLQLGAAVLYYGVQVGTVVDVAPEPQRDPQDAGRVRVRARIWDEYARLVRSRGEDLRARLVISSPIAAQLVVALEDGPGAFGRTDHTARTIATSPSTIATLMSMLEEEIPQTVRGARNVLDQLSGKSEDGLGTVIAALLATLRESNRLLAQLTGESPAPEDSPVGRLTAAAGNASTVLGQIAGSPPDPGADTVVARLSATLRDADELLSQLARSGRAPEGSLTSQLQALTAGLRDAVAALTRTIDQNELLLRGTMRDLQEAANALNQAALRIDESRIMSWRESPAPIPGERGSNR
jgi:ABC-type transporter Mla subunit MlaD